MPAAVYAIATMDTKGLENAFVVQQLLEAGINVKSVDVGSLGPPVVSPDITREMIGAGSELASRERGTAVTAMGQALAIFLRAEFDAGRVAGVIGIGGSGGTALITTAMRGLPIGLPKLMVSTVASGNTSAYVDCADIIMMYSVVDIAGLNVVSRLILTRAAHAMAGMVSLQSQSPDDAQPDLKALPCLGLTMFGVTTPCVTAIRSALEKTGFDCLVFHATGSGGRAMEHLVRSGLIRGVLDMTTTEVADEIVGGIFPAGPARFDAMLDRGIPWVLSLGALDMVNFGAIESVPAEFRARQLHVHNAQVTLMRTTPHECREIAAWIANKLNRSTAPLVVLIPERGVSLLDREHQPFYDPLADAALFEELESRLVQTADRKIIRLRNHINDAEFAAAAVDQFLMLFQAARHLQHSGGRRA